MKLDKKGLIIMVLALIIIIGVLYVTIPRYNIRQQSKGFNMGIQETIVFIIQQASTCQQIPLIMNNQTINMIAVECLNG